MFDKELMRQLRTIPTENRAEWFAERDKLEALADEMTRLNVNDMVQKYGVARVMRVLAAKSSAIRKIMMLRRLRWRTGFRPSALAGILRYGSAQLFTESMFKTCSTSTQNSAKHNPPDDGLRHRPKRPMGVAGAMTP